MVLPESCLIGMRADLVIDEWDFCAILDVGVETLTKVAELVGFDLIIKVLYVLEVFASGCSGAIIGVVPGIDVEVNTSDLAAVVTALEFTVAAPLGDPVLSC